MLGGLGGGALWINERSILRWKVKKLSEKSAKNLRCASPELNRVILATHESQLSVSTVLTHSLTCRCHG